MVVRTEEPMSGPCSVYAESSLCEMLDDFVEEVQLSYRTALQALTAVLAPTRAICVAFCMAVLSPVMAEIGKHLDEDVSED